MIRMVRTPKETAQLSFDFFAPVTVHVVRPAPKAKAVKPAKLPRAPKPKKLAPWEVERERQHALMQEYCDALPDDRAALVTIARSNLRNYHDGAVAGDETVQLDAYLRMDAITWKLYGGKVGVYDHTIAPCMSDQRDWLMEQIGAPAGEVPMFGQRGRFLLDVEGCRVDYRYSGMFGICGGEAHVVDLDRPFFSETGYRSFSVVPYDHILHTGGLGMVVYMTRVLETQLLASAQSDKKRKAPAKVRLHKGPFGFAAHGEEVTNDRLLEKRDGDPAYQPGGHLCALLRPQDIAA